MPRTVRSFVQTYTPAQLFDLQNKAVFPRLYSLGSAVDLNLWIPLAKRDKYGATQPFPFGVVGTVVSRFVEKSRESQKGPEKVSVHSRSLGQSIHASTMETDDLKNGGAEKTARVRDKVMKAPHHKMRELANGRSSTSASEDIKSMTPPNFTNDNNTMTPEATDKNGSMTPEDMVNNGSTTPEKTDNTTSPSLWTLSRESHSAESKAPDTVESINKPNGNDSVKETTASVISESTAVSHPAGMSELASLLAAIEKTKVITRVDMARVAESPQPRVKTGGPHRRLHLQKTVTESGVDDVIAVESGGDEMAAGEPEEEAVTESKEEEATDFKEEEATDSKEESSVWSNETIKPDENVPIAVVEDSDDDSDSASLSPIIMVEGGSDRQINTDHLNPQASTWKPEVDNEDDAEFDKAYPVPEEWHVPSVTGLFAPGALFDGPQIGDVHISVLSYYSHYFAVTLGLDSAAYDAKLSHVLNHVDFPVFRTWIFCRNLVVRSANSAAQDNKIDLKTLIQLWRFGVRIQAPMFSNAVANCIMAKRFNTEDLLDAAPDIEDILSKARPGHVFRTIIAHATILNGVMMGDEFVGMMDRWPKSMIWNVLNWLAMGRTALVGPTALNRGHQCSYHLHKAKEDHKCR